MRSTHRLALLLVLGGCGNVKSNQLPDAPPTADAAIDATARGTVHVTVLDPAGTGAAAVGATVVFLDPDNSLVKKVATDSNGKADADVLPGASVTVTALVNAQVVLETVLAVKPGDNILIGTKPAPTPTTSTFTLSWPAFTGATSYSVSTSCLTTSFPAVAGAVPSGTVDMSSACAQDPMEVVVVPVANNTALSSITKSVKFVPNGTATIAGPYQGTRDFTASYTNINAVISNLDVQRLVPSAVGYPNDQSFMPPASTEVIAITGPLGTGGVMVTQVGNSGAKAAQTIRQSISGMAATYGFDASAMLLPWIKLPTYDATSGKLLVPTDTTGTTSDKPDLFQVVIGYHHTDANNVSTRYTWVIFGPDATDIALPPLPADLGPIGPNATDPVGVVQVGMFEADTVTGYDAVRNDANGLSAALQLYSSDQPPAATARVSTGPSQRVQ